MKLEGDLQVRVPAKVHRFIKEMAARRGVTMREMLEILIKAWEKQNRGK